jgi:hypothetical protein
VIVIDEWPMYVESALAWTPAAIMKAALPRGALPRWVATSAEVPVVEDFVRSVV